MATPPAPVRETAAKGLALRREHGHGGTSVGVARARDLKNGRNISLDTIKRMRSFFARHSAYKYKHKEEPTGPARISWLLWGGDPGREWAESVYQSSLNKALPKSAALAVRKQFWHGTSSKYLQSILKQGLIPATKEKQYEGERGVHISIETFGGIYVTDSLETASGHARNASSRKGGNPLLVGMTLETRSPSALPDEDDILPVITSVVSTYSATDLTDTRSFWGYLFRYQNLDSYSGLKPEFYKLSDAIQKADLTKPIDQFFARVIQDHPRLKERYERQKQKLDMLLAEALRAHAAHLLYLYYKDQAPLRLKETEKNMERALQGGEEISGYKERIKLWKTLPPEVKQGSFQRMVKAITTLSESIREVVDPIAGQDWLRHNARFMSPITYRGKNRIQLVVETIDRTSENDLSRTRYTDIVFHYLQSPGLIDEFLDQYEKSTAGAYRVIRRGKVLRHQLRDKAPYSPVKRWPEDLWGVQPDAPRLSAPALPHERIKGSRKNKPGSASSKNNSIKLGDKTVKALQNKVRDHNKENPSNKVTLGQLKAVYRRGAGAFSTSHRPGKTRAQWAFARVNAFLHLVATGKPKNPKYISDDDLLSARDDNMYDLSSAASAASEYASSLNEGQIASMREEWARNGKLATMVGPQKQNVMVESFYTWFLLEKVAPLAVAAMVNSGEIGPMERLAAQSKIKKLLLDNPDVCLVSPETRKERLAEWDRKYSQRTVAPTRVGDHLVFMIPPSGMWFVRDGAGKNIRSFSSEKEALDFAKGRAVEVDRREPALALPKTLVALKVYDAKKEAVKSAAGEAQSSTISPEDIKALDEHDRALQDVAEAFAEETSDRNDYKETVDFVIGGGHSGAALKFVRRMAGLEEAVEIDQREADEEKESPYLVANTGSATEEAMVAAENALRVPLTEEGRFKMYAFTKEAMSWLDKLHHSDQITPDIVRDKIVKAQARFGDNNGSIEQDETPEPKHKLGAGWADFDQQEIRLERRPAALSIAIGRSAPLEIKKIGQGAFAKVYMTTSGKKRVFIQIPDAKNSYEKEMLASISRDMRSRHLPKTRKVGYDDQNTYYEQPFYRAPLRKADSPEAWKQYRALEGCWHDASNAINRKHPRQNPMYFGYELQNIVRECAKSNKMPKPLLRALELLTEESANYGSTYTFEFSPRNLATDNAGNLILLDVLFDREQMQRQVEAKRRRDAQRGLGAKHDPSRVVWCADDGECYHNGEEFTDELRPDPWALASDAGINILSHMSLLAGYLDESGELIGAVFTSVDEDCYSFDVAVSPAAQGHGVGSALIDIAIDGYDQHLEYYPDVKFCIEAVSPVVEAALARRGFTVTERTATDAALMTRLGAKTRKRTDQFLYWCEQANEGEDCTLDSAEWLVGKDQSEKPVFPGGGVDPGESLKQAAKREAIEETGREPEALKKIKTKPFISKYSKSKAKRQGASASETHAFIGTAPRDITNPEGIVPDDYIDDLQWRSTQDVERMIPKTKRGRWQAKAFKKGLKQAGLASDQNLLAIERSAKPRRMTEQESQALWDRLPRNLLNGWLRNADSAYKAHWMQLLKGFVAFSTDEIHDLGLNVMYERCLDGGFCDQGLSFDQFLYEPIKLYRGGHYKTRVNQNQTGFQRTNPWVSFSLSEALAAKFARSYGGAVTTITRRPIDTYGMWLWSPEEYEVWVPSWHGADMQGGNPDFKGLSDYQLESQINALNCAPFNYKVPHEECKEKNRSMTPETRKRGLAIMNELTLRYANNEGER